MTTGAQRGQVSGLWSPSKEVENWGWESEVLDLCEKVSMRAEEQTVGRRSCLLQPGWSTSLECVTACRPASPMKGPGSSTLAFPSPDSWITKRQHPGKRDEDEEEFEAEERGDLREGGAWRLLKRQHPGRRANQDKNSQVDEEDGDWLPPSRLPDFFLDSWFLDVPQVKRQHPGRRSLPWMESDVTKRQHPGRRFIDPKPQRSWEEQGEGEGVPMPEKRQHPGKRALGHPCGPQGTCGQTGLLQLLGDLSRGQETLEKQSPQLEAWDGEPLLEE